MSHSTPAVRKCSKKHFCCDGWGVHLCHLPGRDVLWSERPPRRKWL